MSAYYNENDAQKAAWLRELIKRGLIAPGDVDERSIVDVRGADLAGYAQCHFFAGIGVWSYALRLAGWPDDRLAWTASFPCPSFSAAGKGQGFDDPRHLWPVGIELIRGRKPPVLFMEQVSAAIGHGWLDLVSDDLERENYAIGTAVLGAHSAGAPHIRQRLYLVAQGDAERERRYRRTLEPEWGPEGRVTAAGAGEDGIVAPLQLGDPNWTRRPEQFRERDESERLAQADRSLHMGEPMWTGLPDSQSPHLRGAGRGGEGRTTSESGEALAHRSGRPGPVNGVWRNADWLLCRDGKWRPVSPGTFPLATGVAGRVGLLRGYGDAICAPVAAAFIASTMEAMEEAAQ